MFMYHHLWEKTRRQSKSANVKWKDFARDRRDRGKHAGVQLQTTWGSWNSAGKTCQQQQQPKTGMQWRFNAVRDKSRTTCSRSVRWVGSYKQQDVEASIFKRCEILLKITIFSSVCYVVFYSGTWRTGSPVPDGWSRDFLFFWVVVDMIWCVALIA